MLRMKLPNCRKVFCPAAILASCLIWFGLGKVAHAAPITIDNFSFELPVLGDGDTTHTVPGWTLVPTGNPIYDSTLTDYEVINPTASQFTGAAMSGSLPAPAAGAQALTFRNTPSTSITNTGTLGNLEGNRRYTLTVAVGADKHFTFGNYRIDLLAGGVLLAPTVTDHQTPAANSFVDSVNQYVIAPNHPLVGSPLIIRLTGTSGSDATIPAAIYMDNVRLDATPITVPPFVLAITCPTNVTMQCASALPAAANDSTSFIAQGGTISDDCPVSVLQFNSADATNNQTCPNRFTITRTYTVRDLCGNIQSCNQTITVNDTTAPAINCPTNVTVQCGSAVPAPATDSAGFIAQGGTISENCGGGVTVSSTDATINQTCPNRFTITRSYTVADTCGNAEMCDQTITINDTTAPAISCPTNVTVQCASAVPTPATDSAGFIAQGGTISENCGGGVTISSTDATNNQICPSRFTITRTYTVTDQCSNSQMCDQTITVNDTTTPTITCPTNVTVQCASVVPSPATDSAGFIAQGGAISENCGDPVTVASSDATNNQTCPSRFIITRTYLVSDLCSNSQSCNQIITVNDTTPPTITCPPNVAVRAGSSAPAPATNSDSFIAQGGTISENCGGSVTVTSTDSPGSQSTTRRYRVTDMCGNFSTCDQLIFFQSPTVSQDFNSGPAAEAGWFHYSPATEGGQSPTWTFPDDGSGGFAYRMMGPPMNCNGLFNRGGSYRTEQYTDFFQAVDILHYASNSVDSLAIIGARITTPGALQTGGYYVAYSLGGPRARQQVMLPLEFSGEINVSEPDIYTGGAAFISQFSPSKQFRMSFLAANDVFTAELYDRTDLLEPIARIRFRNGPTATAAHPSGENLLGWFNLDFNSLCDFTFDNYYAGADPATPIGFPGTPQVVNVTPRPQTLFYSPPQNGSNITFMATTLNLNAVNTNALKLFLNGDDVSDQLVISDTSNPFSSSFFVRYTGVLATNQIYQGQIIALDGSGLGTTNNWVFDTFTASGVVLIEAEDYNYDSGNFQDNPPVSGLDDTTTADTQTSPGNQVNGNGIGYYDLAGTPDVDFHAVFPRLFRTQQYRSSDLVSTAQGLNFTGDTPRPDHVAVNVPDYYVSFMNPGDWMNYTRTFPSGNYNVYLRAASQGRQDVRFDSVTSGSTTSNQTTSIRGQFLVPNTGSSSRYRYVPLSDAAGNIQTLGISGPATFRLNANQVRSGRVAGARLTDLELNYLLFVPTTASPSSGAWIASASPSAGSDNFAPDSAVNIAIRTGYTGLDCPNSIQLRFDGSNVTGSATIACTSSEGAGATVSYRPPGLLLPNSVHTLSVVFADGSGAQSNYWTFTVDPSIPLLDAGDALASVSDSSFTVQVQKGPNDDSAGCPGVGSFPNTIARAERQLAGELIDPSTGQPWPNEAAGTNSGFYTEPNAVNYESCGNSVGFIPGDTTYPGIVCDPNQSPPTHFAIAATIKLQLAQGVFRMGVNSDDQFKVTAGGPDGTNVYLGSSETFPGTRDDGQFDFAVATNGVYEFRLVQEQGSGGANCEWYWVNRTTGVRELVKPLTVELESSATIDGPYSFEPTALIDPSAKTITVPKSGNARFYRLRSTTALRLNLSRFSGDNVVLNYSQ